MNGVRTQETVLHTPGPWFVADHDDFVVAAGSGFSICDCVPGNPYDVTDAQGVENARLIAAAPELLTSLREVLGWYLEGGHAVPRIYIDRANAALAKVEGRS